MEIKEEKNRLALFNNEQQEIGEVIWSDAGPDVIIIDHIFVNPVYYGQKLAEELVYTGVELVRRDRREIILLCLYAKKELEKKPEYQDVLRQSWEQQLKALNFQLLSHLHRVVTDFYL